MVDSSHEGSAAAPADLPQRIERDAAQRAQRFNMAGYAAPPIPNVRVGIIGLGSRGPAHIRSFSRIEGVEIRALCDVRPEKAEAAREKLQDTDHDPALYTEGEDHWQKLCERDDLDLIIVTTPWYMHTPMAVYAMNHGKHVASEVPAAGSIDECWQLVEASERNRTHCVIMENYAYMTFQLLTLNMARHGCFGEIVHGDGAYNTSKIRRNFLRENYWNMWWLDKYAERRGNIYPTHGLGPICQIMDINRGDRLDYLVSIESDDFVMCPKAAELAETDPFFKPYAEKKYRGTMNVTTIRTRRGRTIQIQHDPATPSPHNLIHGIYGTEGAALFDPPPPRLAQGNHKWATPEEYEKLEQQYTPAITHQMREHARHSGHGGSDIQLAWRLIDCLRLGLPVDFDVYDAAAWSSIVPLSEWSVLNRSNSIDVPDFTVGNWQTNPRNMDINLQQAGHTQILNQPNEPPVRD